MPVYPGASIQQQGDHHPRVIRRPAVAVGSVVGVKPGQIHLLDRVQDRPHHVILGHPVQQRWRHQKRLLTVTFDEVRSHAGIVQGTPDGTLFPTATNGAVVLEPVLRGGRRSAAPKGGKRGLEPVAFGPLVRLWVA
jgi:hypothetical protein